MSDVIAQGMKEVCKDLSELESNTPEQRKAFKDREKIFDKLSSNKNIEGGIKLAKRKLSESQKKKIKFEKDRKNVIKELEKIEKKVGKELFRSACNRKLKIDRQKAITQREIKQKEAELERLKKGNIIY